MTVLDSPILAQEARRKALEHARHEARLEGLAIDPAFEGHLDGYVRGDLSADEVAVLLKTAPLPARRP